MTGASMSWLMNKLRGRTAVGLCKINAFPSATSLGQMACRIFLCNPNLSCYIALAVASKKCLLPEVQSRILPAGCFARRAVTFQQGEKHG